MNKVFHNLLSIFIPFFSLCALYSYISDLLPGFTRLSFIELGVVLITGLICQLIFVITRKERVSPFSYIRVFTLMYIIYWFFLLILNEGTLTQRLKPSMPQVLLIIMLALQYVWSMYLSNLFYEYEQFLDFCKDFKGTELFSKLREQGEITSSSAGALRMGVILSFLPVIIISTISLIIGRDIFTIRASTLVFSALSCLFSAFTFAYVSITKDERYYAGQGLQTVFEKSKQRFRFSIVIITISTFLALMYAKPDALFVENGQTPFYLAFLAWLIDFLNSRKRVSVNPEFQIPPQNETTEDFNSDFLTPPEGLEEFADFSWIFDILKVVSLTLLAVLLITAIFGPFFKKDWSDFWKEKRFLKYIVQFFKAFKEFLKTLFFGSTENNKTIILSESAKKLANSLEEFAHLKKSKEKKAEIGRLSKKYISLCVWGENAGSPCSAATAPFEYAGQLYNHILWYKDELFAIAELFEKALFSASLVSEEEEKEFYRLIETVISLNTDNITQHNL